jgi:hypothetical protein
MGPLSNTPFQIWITNIFYIINYWRRKLAFVMVSKEEALATDEHGIKSEPEALATVSQK